MVKLVLRAFKGLGIYQDLPSFLPFFFFAAPGSIQDLSSPTKD